MTQSNGKEKKSMRHFYCVDRLWETFDQMAGELGCSIDHLINEVMRGFARSKGRLSSPASHASPAPRAPVPPSPPQPRTPPPKQPPPPPRPRALVLLFDGQPVAIAKDTFVIGRRGAGTDLVVKDGNISRRHAAVIRKNGAYYLKDLGSTNGIDFQGSRIESKRIDEGDTFHLCGHELRFTYRAAS
jgi:neural Wiskott-Aldrich syndrome protein